MTFGFARTPSARPRDLLCNRFESLTIIIGTDPMLQLVHLQLSSRFGDGPRAMHPCGCDAVQPGTRARQGAPHPATAAVPLAAPLGHLAPCPDGVAAGPRGLLPPPQQGGFACGGHPVRQPRPTRRRHGTDRPPMHKAAEPPLGGRASPPLTRDRFGRRGVAVRLVLEHTEWLGGCPGLEGGRGTAAPPDRILTAPNPRGMSERQREEASTPRFFRADCGAGRVRQGCARCQWVCSRVRARRRVSSRSRRSVTPGASHTSAARAHVHTPGGVP